MVHQRQRWTNESEARIFRISFWTFWRKCCWESCTRPGKLQGGPRADCYKLSYGCKWPKKPWVSLGLFHLYNHLQLYNPRLPNTFSGSMFEVCVGGGFKYRTSVSVGSGCLVGWMCFFFRSSPWNPTSRAMKLNIWGRLVVEFPSNPKQNLGTFGYLQAVLLVNFAGLFVFSYSWYRVL